MNTDTSALEPVNIDVVSDVMCPWCYIGKRRLEGALEGLDDVAVKVTWRPFQLDSTLPATGRDRGDYLAQKFGTPERIAEIYGRIAAEGEREGIDFAFDRIKVSPNTLDAHRVIRWASIEGVQDGVVEELFRAYFLEGANLTDRETLADIAARGGMDRAVVARLLETDADLADTEAEIVRAQSMGVQGVPCFILDGRYAVSGAQPAELLADVIRKVAVERAGGSAGPNADKQPADNSAG